MPELRNSNRLIEQKSPYLLQHAHNPVDRYPWSDEAFEKAKRKDKPIFLSIGIPPVTGAVVKVPKWHEGLIFCWLRLTESSFLCSVFEQLVVSHRRHISFCLFSAQSILFSARRRSTSVISSSGFGFPRLSMRPFTPFSSYLRTQLYICW